MLHKITTSQSVRSGESLVVNGTRMGVISGRWIKPGEYECTCAFMWNIKQVICPTCEGDFCSNCNAGNVFRLWKPV